MSVKNIVSLVLALLFLITGNIFSQDNTSKDKDVNFKERVKELVNQQPAKKVLNENTDPPGPRTLADVFVRGKLIEMWRVLDIDSWIEQGKDWGTNNQAVNITKRYFENLNIDPKLLKMFNMTKEELAKYASNKDFLLPGFNHGIQEVRTGDMTGRYDFMNKDRNNKEFEEDLEELKERLKNGDISFDELFGKENWDYYHNHILKTDYFHLGAKASKEYGWVFPEYNFNPDRDPIRKWVEDNNQADDAVSGFNTEKLGYVFKSSLDDDEVPSNDTPQDTN